jgi:hypothetical protein
VTCIDGGRHQGEALLDWVLNSDDWRTDDIGVTRREALWSLRPYRARLAGKVHEADRKMPRAGRIVTDDHKRAAYEYLLPCGHRESGVPPVREVARLAIRVADWQHTGEWPEAPIHWLVSYLRSQEPA